MAQGKTKISDVARYAGVAISTVSRVVNGLDRVSEETRQKVLNAIEVLAFKPNITAKTLKAKKSDAIGFICEDISSPYTPEMIRGIEETASRADINVILCNSNWDHETTIKHLEVLQNRNIDGIIYSTPMRITEPLLGKLKKIQEQIPLVLISEGSLNDGFARVESEVENGMAMVMQHLFTLGHKKISMIAGPEDSDTNTAKIDSYMSQMESAGFGGNIRYEYTNFSIEQAIEVTKTFLSKDKAERPTAIIGAADLCAIGALTAVKKLGFKVPEDISITGWGGIDFGLYTDPPITSLTVPRFELGIKAMEWLLEEITYRKPSRFSARRCRLPMHLEVRGSTGPLL
jgi:DNA-binding LacI/PurR family transcriptional regulator